MTEIDMTGPYTKAVSAHSKWLSENLPPEVYRLFSIQLGAASFVFHEAFIKALAAQMEAAGVKCVGPDTSNEMDETGENTCDDNGFLTDYDGPAISRGQFFTDHIWRNMHDAAPCLFQTAVKGDG